MIRRALLVEIGSDTAALPPVTPPAVSPPSQWVPNPRPSPALLPPSDLAVEVMVDAAKLTWTKSPQPGAATVVEGALDAGGVPGAWVEITRTGDATYTIALPAGAFWVRLKAVLNALESVYTNAVLANPRSSAELEQGLADVVAEQLAAEAARAQMVIDRQQADAQVALDAAADATAKAAAEAQARADAILNERNDWTAAVELEESTRQSEVESLATSLSLVSAGSGEQFDSRKIWYFDSELESWGGNGAPTIVDGWLRPANHASDPYVRSPTGLAIEGQSYRFVKLRIKKVGNPVWQGQVRWRKPGDGASTWSGPNTIPEPSFDANGVTAVSWQDIAWWPATIDQIRIDLSAAQTATDYFLVDWVAIGRPTPGAGVALVQDETAARQSADSAEALQRTTLAAQMRGTYEGTDAAQVTQGLVYSERQARVTAISAEATEREALASQVNDPNTGLPKAHSRITEVDITAANANSATANRVDIAEASLNAIGGNGTNALWSEYSYFPSSSPLPAAISKTAGITVDTVVTSLGVGGRMLRLRTTSANAGEEFRFSESTTDYNIPLGPGEYIVSYVAFGTVAGHQIRVDVIEDDGTQRPGIDAFLTTAPVRYSHRVTMDAATKNARLRVLANRSMVAGRTVYLDQLMIERAVGPSSSPSAWTVGPASRGVQVNASVLGATNAIVSQQGDDITALSNSLVTTNARIDNLPEVYVQPTMPPGTAYDVGDQWIDTSTPENKLHTWSGTQWIAGVTMQGATIFAQPTAPAANAVNDLWYDTSDSNKPHRWSGSAWVDVSDPRTSATAATVVSQQSQISQNASGLTTLSDSLNQVSASIGGKGSNVLRGEHSFFPAALPALYSTTGLTVDSVLTSQAFGGRALRLQITTTNVSEELSLSASTSDFNVPLQIGDYIVSYYAWSNVAGHQIRADVIEGGSVQRPGPATALTTQPVRYSHRITVGAGVSAGRLRFLPNRSGVSGRNVYLDRLMIEPVTGSSSTPSAWVPGSAVYQSQSNSSATQSLSVGLSDLGGVVSGHTSAITQVNLDLGDKADLSVTQGLRADVDSVTGKVNTGWFLALNANNKFAGVKLGNDGAISNAAFLFDGFDFITADGSFQITGGREITRAGGYMEVRGKPFGVNSEFMYWYGPEKANINDCNRSSAIHFKTVSGLNFSLGGILGGVITAGGQTTTLSAPVVYSTGAFGTNGAPITVNAAYAYSKTQSTNSTNGRFTAGSGTTSAVLELWRKIGTGAFQLVGSTTATGVMNIVSPGDATDVVTWNINGGINYTDNAGGTQNRTYELRLISRSLQAANHNGQGAILINREQQNTGVQTAEG